MLAHLERLMEPVMYAGRTYRIGLVTVSGCCMADCLWMKVVRSRRELILGLAFRLLEWLYVRLLLEITLTRHLEWM